MKMSKKQFGLLADSINSVLSKHSLKVIANHRTQVHYVKCQFVAFCWSIFYASKFDCKKLYAAGLDDSHIETALKRILSDFI
ncbi:hypothetical protein LCGC14_2464970 [marine sediment metagenome]|uniref:Uncharacterized protein n=1 Tax=marine sediment metagenome TaxID=412755 RepID=A0A0F9BCN7_9ZZZZ